MGGESRGLHGRIKDRDNHSNRPRQQVETRTTSCDSDDETRMYAKLILSKVRKLEGEVAALSEECSKQGSSSGEVKVMDLESEEEENGGGGHHGWGHKRGDHDDQSRFKKGMEKNCRRIHDDVVTLRKLVESLADHVKEPESESDMTNASHSGIIDETRVYVKLILSKVRKLQVEVDKLSLKCSELCLGSTSAKVEVVDLEADGEENAGRGNHGRGHEHGNDSLNLFKSEMEENSSRVHGELVTLRKLVESLVDHVKEPDSEPKSSTQTPTTPSSASNPLEAPSNAFEIVSDDDSKSMLEIPNTNVSSSGGLTKPMKVEKAQVGSEVTMPSSKSPASAQSRFEGSRSMQEASSSVDPIVNLHPGTSISTEVVSPTPKELTSSQLLTSQKEKPQKQKAQVAQQTSQAASKRELIDNDKGVEVTVQTAERTRDTVVDLGDEKKKEHHKSKESRSSSSQHHHRDRNQKEFRSRDRDKHSHSHRDKDRDKDTRSLRSGNERHGSSSSCGHKSFRHHDNDKDRSKGGERDREKEEERRSDRHNEKEKELSSRDRDRDHKSSGDKDKEKHRLSDRGRDKDKKSEKERHGSTSSSGHKSTHHHQYRHDKDKEDKERSKSQRDREKEKERRSDRDKGKDKDKVQPGKEKESRSEKERSSKHANTKESEKGKDRHRDKDKLAGESQSPKSVSTEKEEKEVKETTTEKIGSIPEDQVKPKEEIIVVESESTVTTSSNDSTSSLTVPSTATPSSSAGEMIHDDAGHASIGSEHEVQSPTIKSPDFTEDPSSTSVEQMQGQQEPLFQFQATLEVPDLVEFKASFFNVSHNDNSLKGPYFPDSPVAVVGRIDHGSVWEYIEKLKESKEIITFRLSPATAADSKGYMTYFTYLSSRGRLGVIGGRCFPVKDVYLLPLEKNQPMPAILEPCSGPGLPKERTPCLLAIVTRHVVSGGLKRKLSAAGAENSEKKTKIDEVRANDTSAKMGAQSQVDTSAGHAPESSTQPMFDDSLSTNVRTSAIPIIEPDGDISSAISPASSSSSVYPVGRKSRLSSVKAVPPSSTFGGDDDSEEQQELTEAEQLTGEDEDQTRTRASKKRKTNRNKSGGTARQAAVKKTNAPRRSPRIPKMRTGSSIQSLILDQSLPAKDFTTQTIGGGDDLELEARPQSTSAIGSASSSADPPVGGTSRSSTITNASNQLRTQTSGPSAQRTCHRKNEVRINLVCIFCQKKFASKRDLEDHILSCLA